MVVLASQVQVISGWEAPGLQDNEVYKQEWENRVTAGTWNKTRPV